MCFGSSVSVPPAPPPKVELPPPPPEPTPADTKKQSAPAPAQTSVDDMGRSTRKRVRKSLTIASALGTPGFGEG